MTVKEAISYIAKRIEPVSDEAVQEAKLLVSFLTEEETGKLNFCDKTLEKDPLDSIVAKRLEGLPVQYIIGKWWFYKGEFFVGEGVLIPRQDTETLVETAVEFLKDKPNASVCDLCAGSGCVGISIANDYPNASVLCLEKYDEAFSFLEKNILHNKADNVKPLKVDVTAEAFGRYDLIVSNPPYITGEDMQKLSAEVKKEPQTALFGGDDGLYFYRQITKLWKDTLKEGGALAFEVGINEADAVCQILKENNFTKISVKTDLCGVQRVVFGTVSSI